MNERSATDRIDQFSKAGPFQAREILEGFIKKDSPLVLDIGTGSGLWAIEAARLGAREVTAVDVNQERVSFLVRQAEQLGFRNIHALQGTAEKLPVNSAFFDLVIASLVFHEVNDLTSALREVRRVLRDSGTLIVVELQPSVNQHHPRLDSKILANSLANHDFTLTEIKEQDNWYAMVAKKGAMK